MACFSWKTASLLVAMTLLVPMAIGCGASDANRYTVAARCSPTDSGCRATSNRWWRRFRGAARRGQGTIATGGSCPGGGVGFANSCSEGHLVAGDGPVRSTYGGYSGSGMATNVPTTVGTRE